MRLTEWFKSQPKTQLINQDNQQYEFTPGEGGSLIVKNPKMFGTNPLDIPDEDKVKSKTVPTKSETGATRG